MLFHDRHKRAFVRTILGLFFFALTACDAKQAQEELDKAKATENSVQMSPRSLSGDSEEDNEYVNEERTILSNKEEIKAEETVLVEQKPTEIAFLINDSPLKPDQEKLMTPGKTYSFQFAKVAEDQSVVEFLDETFPIEVKSEDNAISCSQVDKNYLCAAQKAGKAKIVVTYNDGNSKEYLFNIPDLGVISLGLKPAANQLKVGDSHILKLIGFDSNGSHFEIVDQDKASVKIEPEGIVEMIHLKDGLHVQAVNPGVAVIKIEYEDRKLQWPITVKGSSLVSITAEVATESGTAESEKQFPIKVWGNYSDQKRFNLSRWVTLTDLSKIFQKIELAEDFASIMMITDLSGEAPLDFQFLDFKTPLKVNVEEALKFDFIKLKPPYLKVAVGGKMQAVVVGVIGAQEFTIDPEKITWVTKNSSIIKVDPTGIITGQKEGSAQIEVAFKNYSKHSLIFEVVEAVPSIIYLRQKNEEFKSAEVLNVPCGSGFQDFVVDAELTDGSIVDVTLDDRIVISANSEESLPLVVGADELKGRYNSIKSGVTTLKATYINPELGVSLEVEKQVVVEFGVPIALAAESDDYGVPLGYNFSFFANLIDACSQEQGVFQDLTYELITAIPADLTIDVSGKNVTTGGVIAAPMLLSFGATYQKDDITLSDTIDVTIEKEVVEKLKLKVVNSDNRAGQHLVAFFTENLDIEAEASMSNKAKYDKAKLISEGYTLTWTDVDAGYQVDYNNAGDVDTNGVYLADKIGMSRVTLELEKETKFIKKADAIVISANRCTNNGERLNMGYLYEKSYIAYCFYKGQAGESCQATCDAEGKTYNAYTTEELIGSKNLNETDSGPRLCSNIGYSFYHNIQSSSSTFNMDTGVAGQGIGCSVNTLVNLLFRMKNIETNALDSSPNMERFCGCD